MNKINVSTGVYWIEIPEENFYLLCGAPADSVKYMMKKGLIVSTEKNNISYETGPNAILLSDSMVQNGSFSNLAEFPVLQMLYRQGLIIPNHPNNSGKKPLLIGSKDQVNAQMQYIFRGNYGLTSVEEIADVGFSREEAENYMRMKLKFAFGSIRDTETLLDSVFIADQKVEVKKNIFIQRKHYNIFEISYQDDCYTIDLNLPKNKQYDIPYPLGFYNLERDYFSVVHSGEGDGWDINRSCMSSIIMYKGKIYLIDAGPNIQHALNALGISIDEVEGLFHTHAHDDHFSGLTTLMRSDHKIKYFATPLVRQSVIKKFSVLLGIDEAYFAKLFEVHDLKFDHYFNLDGLEVLALNSPHPIETNLFIFRSMGEEGYKSYAHFADITSFSVLDTMVEEDKSKIGISKAYCEQIKQTYLTPADIKKIDIGGGMIHGCAEDFKQDKSKIIILAHTALELTNTQKSIGSGAPFGTVNKLIPTYKNYFYYRADLLLNNYFKEILSAKDSIKNLLNSPIISFNPDTIIVKESEEVDFVYMILSGNVSKINRIDHNSVLISSGSIIAENAVLNNMQARYTYRSNSFVNVLRIAKPLFFYLYKQHGFEKIYLKNQDIKVFLRSCFLFEESISSNTLNILANGIEVIHVNKGQHILKEISDHKIIIIKKGKTELVLNNVVVEQLNETDFFNEDYTFYDSKPVLDAVAIEDSILYTIPGELIKDIPIINLKIIEVREIRSKNIIVAINKEPNLLLKDKFNFSPHIRKNDRQRQNIIHSINLLWILSASNNIKNRQIYQVNNVAYHLVEEVKKYFYLEESLLILYKYPEFRKHRKSHKIFTKQLLEIKNNIDIEALDSIPSQLIEIKKWLEIHFIEDDRKYASFLNDKGIF